MKKKFLSVLLALCMVAGTATASPEQMIVQAAEEENVDAVGDQLRYGNYQYQVQQDGTVMITKYYDDGTTNIVIPSEIDGKKVTSIGWNEYSRSVFNDCTNLTDVTIPDTVTTIGCSAFESCNSLTNITIPDSVTRIGLLAFACCNNLSSVTIPSSVTNIERSTFSSCEGLTSVTIPDSVTNIGEFAFNDCRSLTNIVIPSSVTTIERYAFSLCSSLAGITIPVSVQTVDEYAFSECSSLKNVIFLNSKTQFDRESVFFHSPNVSISYGDQDQNTDNNSTDNNNNNGQKIIALSTIKSSVTSVTYTGKAQQPTVVITDTTGQTVDSSNYTLTYSNNKNVGQATVTATGIGNYTGTLTAVFNIVPKGTNLSKVTAKKKSFLAKWKKQSAQTSGYELQYATNAKFKGAKIKTVKKNKTTSIAVKKLKAKKKYYVRVRTYKTVKINGKSTKLYSNWSKAKTVKVK